MSNETQQGESIHIIDMAKKDVPLPTSFFRVEKFTSSSIGADSDFADDDSMETERTGDRKRHGERFRRPESDVVDSP